MSLSTHQYKPLSLAEFTREVKQAASGNWLNILSRQSCGIQKAIDRVGKHIGCPIHGGKDGLRLYRDANQTGGGVCNTCGSYPDGFARLMWLNDWSFKQAVDAVADDLRMAPPQHERKQHKPVAPLLDNLLEQGKRQQKIQETWQQAVANHDGDLEKQLKSNLEKRVQVIENLKLLIEEASVLTVVFDNSLTSPCSFRCKIRTEVCGVGASSAIV